MRNLKTHLRIEVLGETALNDLRDSKFRFRSSSYLRWRGEVR